MDFVAILAGGSGTRFWPKSRRVRPKQFLAFGGGEPLLVRTFERTRSVAPPRHTLVVTGAAHVGEVARLLPRVPRGNVVGETAGRDTAPAVAVAALIAARTRSEDATLLVCPADHAISTTAKFAAAARAADQLLAKHPSRLVVFGVKPTEPATGFGYVEQGASLGRFGRLPCFDVAKFHEKPPLERARDYVASGRFLWNAGIFAFRAGALLDEVRRQLPQLAKGLDALAPAVGTRRFAAQFARVQPRLPKVSIDRGVMEGARARALVVPDWTWDDVGSFAALERAHPRDTSGNVALGECVAIDAKENVVDAGDGLVALVGVTGLVVVHTHDVTLVCRKERCEEVKALIEKVKRRRELERHL